MAPLRLLLALPFLPATASALTIQWDATAPQPCPSPETFVQSLRTRLDASALRRTKGVTLSVALHQDADGFVAIAHWYPEFAPSSRRQLTSRDCPSLLETLAVVVSMWIDGLPGPPAGRHRPATAAHSLPSSPVPARRTDLRANATVGVHLGELVRPGSDVSLGAAIHRGAWSVELEGRLAFPRPAPPPAAEGLRIGTAAVGVMLCRRVGPLSACPLGRAGVWWLTGRLSEQTGHVRPFLQLGGRLGSDMELRSVRVGTFVELTTAPARLELRNNSGLSLWKSPLVSLRVGFRLELFGP